LRTGLGALAHETMLSGQKVIPTKVMKAGKYGDFRACAQFGNISPKDAG